MTLQRAAAPMLAAYCAVVLAVCLTPFDFEPVTVERVARAEWIPLTRVCPTHGPRCLRDPLRNVALYVPLGVLVAVARPRSGVLTAAVAGGVLSLMVEAAQLAVPSRAPSTTDLIANALGATAGAALVRAARPRAVS